MDPAFRAAYDALLGHWGVPVEQLDAGVRVRHHPRERLWPGRRPSRGSAGRPRRDLAGVVRQVAPRSPEPSRLRDRPDRRRRAERELRPQAHQDPKTSTWLTGVPSTGSRLARTDAVRPLVRLLARAHLRAARTRTGSPGSPSSTPRTASPACGSPTSLRALPGLLRPYLARTSRSSAGRPRACPSTRLARARRPGRRAPHHRVRPPEAPHRRPLRTLHPALLVVVAGRTKSQNPDKLTHRVTTLIPTATVVHIDPPPTTRYPRCTRTS